MLVALNSVFQVVAYSALGRLCVDLLPSVLGLETDGINAAPLSIAGSVVVFLGVPLLLGYLSRRIRDSRRGRDWYEHVALPRIGAGSMLRGRSLGMGYQKSNTIAFTAAGNNFELAIAVAIATWGASFGQALAGVVGPLIEVPVLVDLVYVALATRKHFMAASVEVTR